MPGPSCASPFAWRRRRPIPHAKQERRQFLSAENIIVSAERCMKSHRVYRYFTIYIDTPGDAPAREIYGSLKYGLVHGENVPNVSL